MVYTVTLNPALDYIVHLDRLRPGCTNRSTGDSILFGGKGTNVSVILGRLGVPSVALGFLGGFTGREIQRQMEEAGLVQDFCQVEGNSRINLKVKGEEETEINGTGPAVTPGDLDRLFAKLDLLGPGDTLVLAGSVPPSVPRDIYEAILAGLEGRGVRAAVDAEGSLLRRVLRLRPFLIKPNHLELGDLFGQTLRTPEDAVRHARLLQGEGARNVLVSMAGEGAVYVGEDGTVLRAPAPQGRVVNSAGAGDAMLAGFLAGLAAGKDPAGALGIGVAAGSATAFAQGLADAGAILALEKALPPIERIMDKGEELP